MYPILNRIRAVINTKGVSDTQFAKTCGIPQATFSNMFQRQSEPKSDLLEKIVRIYAISPEWLLTGEGEMFAKAPQSAVSTAVHKIPLLRQSVSCGPGQEWQGDDNIETYIEPAQAFSALEKKHIYAFYARGISMIGLGIQDGDILFFDGDKDQPLDDDVYVFGLHGEAYCKFLHFEPLENSVSILSCQTHDMREAKLVKTVDIDTDGFRIFGRVLCWMHENRIMRR